MSRKQISDDEEEEMIQASTALRRKLKLEKKQGYILSTERTMWSSAKLVIISKFQMDSAVRLWRLQVCVCVGCVCVWSLEVCVSFFLEVCVTFLF